MSFTTTATHPTLVAVPLARPALQRAAWTAAFVAIGVAFIAALAQLRITVPASPVPITGQTLAVLLIGMAYGSRLGPATALAYVLAGLAGLPLFTNGGAGWATLSGATGGYLIGFIIAAALVGWLAERGWDRTPWLTIAAMAAGNLVIYACGVLWLQHFPTFGWERVFALGVRPFLVGDALKIALAAAALPGTWWLKDRARR